MIIFPPSRTAWNVCRKFFIALTVNLTNEKRMFSSLRLHKSIKLNRRQPEIASRCLQCTKASSAPKESSPVILHDHDETEKIRPNSETKAWISSLRARKVPPTMFKALKRTPIRINGAREHTRAVKNKKVACNGNQLSDRVSRDQITASLFRPASATAPVLSRAGSRRPRADRRACASGGRGRRILRFWPIGTTAARFLSGGWRSYCPRAAMAERRWVWWWGTRRLLGLLFLMLYLKW